MATIFCMSCGKPNEAGGKFCIYCGAKLATPAEQGQQAEVAYSAYPAAAASPTLIAPAPDPNAVPLVNIWTELLTSDSKNEIHSPPPLDLQVSQDEFAAAMKGILAKNEVAANLQTVDVVWDEGKVTQRRILVTDASEHESESKNTHQILVGVDEVGRFTYVEEKTFIERPNLPPHPGEYKKTIVNAPDKPGLISIVGGALVTAAGLYFLSKSNTEFGVIGLFAGIAGLVYYLARYNAYNDGKARRAAEERRRQDYDNKLSAWNRAWEEWDARVLRAAYMTSTNDVFGRFKLAVRSVVRLTIKELFEDRNAELRKSQDREYTEDQINQLLQKRKEKFS